MHADHDGLPRAVADGPQSVASAVRIDASQNLEQDLEIGQCQARLRLLVAAGFAMTLFSAGLAFDLWDGFGSYDMSVGHVGVVGFGLLTSWLIWMLPAGRGPVVVVTPYGIRDLRIGNEFLPWDWIAEVSAEECRGHRVMVLTPTPALLRQLSSIRAMPRDARADRIVIASAGLTADFDTLLRACRDCHAAGRSRTALQQKDERDSRGFAVQAS